MRGEGLGRKLGFPTANLAFEGLAPERGVWAVSVEGFGPAVCNVGMRPTVSQERRIVVEVHIPGYSGDLYGKKLNVDFLRRLREERKFQSVDELKAQIAADIADLLR